MRRISLCSFLFVLFAILTFSPVFANAALIYEQATLETTDRGAYQYFGQQLADDFVPIVSEALETITWRGSYYGTDNPSATESFTIQLFTDNAGLPSDTPFFEVVGLASKVASGTLLGKTLYDYSISVSGPVLNTGTTYWINIYTNDFPSNYAWANSTDGTTDGALRSGAGTWLNYDNDVRSNHVFALNGSDEVFPDLIVSSLAAGIRTYGTPMVRGVFANYMVTNQGSADAVSSCLDFYLSRDAVIDPGDVYLGRENIPALTAGNSYGSFKDFRRSFDNWQPASGTWRVIAEADACDDNEESDETNNQTSTVAGIVK